jgi:prophage maintenance system killer protein
MASVCLKYEEVIEIHGNQLQLHGGSFGLRDAGLLESAILQPQASSLKPQVEFDGTLFPPGLED